MLELVFLRHGETDSNKKETYLGWTDTDLNEEGIRQAQCAKQKLLDAKFDFIYSSPLKRAVQTARVLAKGLNTEIIVDNSLKERNFGIWEDITYKEITLRYPKEHDLWIKDWVNYCIPEGESCTNLYERVEKFIDDLIMSIHESENISVLIVTHLGCIRNAISHLLGMGVEGFWRFKISNCGITKVQIVDNYSVITLLNG